MSHVLDILSIQVSRLEYAQREGGMWQIASYRSAEDRTAPTGGLEEHRLDQR